MSPKLRLLEQKMVNLNFQVDKVGWGDSDPRE